MRITKCLLKFCAIISLISLLLNGFTVAAASKASVAFGKSSLSQYTSQSKLSVREELLWSFDKKDYAGIYTVDTTDSTEGNSCGMVTFDEDLEYYTVFRLKNQIKVDASEIQKVTLKIDVWVNDMSLLECDHELQNYPQYDYSNSGTFYWIMYDKDGKSHEVDTTVMDNKGKPGWQTMEVPFVHHNGELKLQDYSNITSVRILTTTRKGIVIKFDNLRACYYSNTGYKPYSDGFPEGCRIISRCDADALDGALVSEWFGNSFDFTHQKFGGSCLAYECCTADDYRVYFGGYNIDVNYNKDYICFWVWVPKEVTIPRWFLELNYKQDKIEYQNPNWSIDNITSHAVDGFKQGQWNLIQLPLNTLQKTGTGDTLTVRHFRMVVKSSKGVYPIYFDNVYICNASEAAEAAKEYRSIMKAENSTSSKLPSTSSKLSSNASKTPSVSSDASVGSQESQTASGVTTSIAEESLSDDTESLVSDFSDEAPFSSVSGSKKSGKGAFVVIGALLAVAVAGGVILLITAKKRKNS